MRTKLIVAALAAAGLSSFTAPAMSATKEAAMLQKLAERMEKLEARNAEL